MARHHSQVQLSPLQELYLGSCSYYGNIQYIPVNGDGKRKEMCFFSRNMASLHSRKLGNFALINLFQLNNNEKYISLCLSLTLRAPVLLERSDARAFL